MGSVRFVVRFWGGENQRGRLILVRADSTLAYCIGKPTETAPYLKPSRNNMHVPIEGLSPSASTTEDKLLALCRFCEVFIGNAIHVKIRRMSIPFSCFVLGSNLRIHGFCLLRHSQNFHSHTYRS